jgi:hypothetical protein
MEKVVKIEPQLFSSNEYFPALFPTLSYDFKRIDSQNSPTTPILFRASFRFDKYNKCLKWHLYAMHRGALGGQEIFTHVRPILKVVFSHGSSVPYLKVSLQNEELDRFSSG